MNAWLSALVCLGFVSFIPDDPKHALPDRHSRYDDLSSASTTVITGDPELELFVKSDGPGKRVELRWSMWSESTMTQVLVPRFVKTDYHPLAVCVEAARSDAFFVVGWDADANETLVERWVVRALRPVVSGYNALGEAEFEDLVWSHTTEEIAAWSGQLVYEAVFHPMARELLVLRDGNDEGSEREIVGIDVDKSADPVLRFSREQIPSIDTAVWLTLAVTEDEERVFVFVKPPTNDSVWAPNRPHLRTHVLIDVDHDGRFEISFSGHVDAIPNRVADVAWSDTYRAAPRVR